MINRVKWVPLSHRFDVYSQSQEYFQQTRLGSLQRQKAWADRMEEKANELIDFRKMGDRGLSELAQLMNSLPQIKAEKKQKTLKDQYFATNKYTYDLPPMIIWNQIELKL